LLNALTQKIYDSYQFDKEEIGLKIRLIPQGNSKAKAFLETQSLREGIHVSNSSPKSFEKLLLESELAEIFMLEFIHELGTFSIVMIDSTDKDSQMLIHNLTQGQSNVLVIHNFKDVTTQEALDERINVEILQAFDVTKHGDDDLLDIKVNFYCQEINGKTVRHLVLVRGNSLMQQVNLDSLAYLETILEQNENWKKMGEDGIIQQFVDFINQKLEQYVTIPGNTDEEALTFTAQFDRTLGILRVEPSNEDWELNYSAKERLFSLADVSDP